MSPVQLPASLIESLSNPEHRKGRWESVSAELHLDRSEVLVMVEARDFYPNEVPLALKQEIAAVVAGLCSGVVSSWSVIFTNRGQQYDGAVANEL